MPRPGVSTTNYKLNGSPQVEGHETLSDMLALLSQAAEFQDVQLRHDEKSPLNALNSKKNGATGLRFPIKGRIKDRDCKVNW